MISHRYVIYIIVVFTCSNNLTDAYLNDILITDENTYHISWQLFSWQITMEGIAMKELEFETFMAALDAGYVKLKYPVPSSRVRHNETVYQTLPWRHLIMRIHWHGWIWYDWSHLIARPVCAGDTRGTAKPKLVPCSSIFVVDCRFCWLYLCKVLYHTVIFLPNGRSITSFHHCLPWCVKYISSGLRSSQNPSASPPGCVVTRGPGAIYFTHHINPMIEIYIQSPGYLTHDTYVCHTRWHYQLKVCRWLLQSLPLPTTRQESGQSTINSDVLICR